MTSFVIENSITLDADPVAAGQASTKQYIDGKLTGISTTQLTGVSGMDTLRLPALTGGKLVAGGGSSVLNLTGTVFGAGTFVKATVDTAGVITNASAVLTRSDLPSDLPYTKIVGDKPTTISGYGLLDAVSLSGNETMTGMLATSVGSFASGDLVTKGYVDATRAATYVPSVHETGDISLRSSAGTPNGYFRCNGAVLSKASYASLYAVVGDSYSLTPLAGAGQPWRRQYEFNKVSNGDLTWGTTTSLPGTLGAAQAVVTKDRVYLIGGVNAAGVVVTTTYTAPISADGTIGNWTTTTPAPNAAYMAQAFVLKNRVYFIGGQTNSTPSNQVHHALIQPDGMLGAWVAGTNLPANVALSQAVITKNRVYLLGGIDSNNGYVANCYTATYDYNGVLGSWSLTSPLPTTLGSHNAVVTKNKVYLIGGYTGSTWYSNLLVADLNVDGTIGNWSVGPAIPYQTYEQVVTIGDRVYRIGAWNGTTVTSAPINSDGTLGAFTANSSLPSKLCYSQSIVTSSKVYSLSGFDGVNWVSTCMMASFSGGKNDYTPYYQTDLVPGAGNPARQQYGLNYNEATDIKNWANGTTLPGDLAHHSVIVTKNKMHVIGGSNGSGVYNTSVWTADINSNGIVGEWSVSQTLPTTFANSSVLVVKNKVYMLGGVIGGSISSAIYCANINADGSLGVWSSVGNLPSISTAATAVATRNRVYLLSGYDSSTTTTTATYTATINDDGTLGTWYAGYSLPASVGYGQSVVAGGYVHVIAGFSAPAGTAAGVYSAPILSDGTLGPWVTGMPIGPNISYHMSFATKSRVFVLGGVTGSSSSAVYSCPISADGSLGGWVKVSDLPVPIYQSALALTGSRIYIIGGRQNGPYSANTLYAPFAGGMNDYSLLYNGVTTVTSSAEFRIPDLSSVEKSGKYFYIKY